MEPRPPSGKRAHLYARSDPRLRAAGHLHHEHAVVQHLVPFREGRHPVVAHWWDQWTETATEVLFAGKFNSMFSMLFAIGFTIQLERLEARDPAHAHDYLPAADFLAVRVRRHSHVRVLDRRRAARLRAARAAAAGAAPGTGAFAVDPLRPVPVGPARHGHLSLSGVHARRPRVHHRYRRAWEASNNSPTAMDPSSRRCANSA